MQPDVTPKAKSKGKIGKLIIKVIVTILCFWYISTKINFTDALHALIKANWGLLLLSVLFIIFSKVLAAFRLNINFKNINLFISEWNNIKLFWIGMFYNLFLPGAISGDAYKVIVLNKKFNTSYKKLTAAVILDRFSGLLALGILLSTFSVMILPSRLHDLLIIAASLFAIIFLYFLVRIFQKDFLPGFLTTFLWGIGVQTFMVASLFFILLSLDITTFQSEWIFIFLIAAVVSVLPLSLGGGLGTREVVFAEGAIFFHLDPRSGVIISLLFYIVNVIASLPGLYYIFNDPLKMQEEPL